MLQPSRNSTFILVHYFVRVCTFHNRFGGLRFHAGSQQVVVVLQATRDLPIKFEGTFDHIISLQGTTLSRERMTTVRSGPRPRDETDRSHTKGI